MQRKILKLGLLSIFLGVVLLFLSGAGWLPSISYGAFSLVFLLEESGRALVLAGLLSLTAERILTWHLIQEVARGVEVYYLTYALPASFAEEVRCISHIQSARNDYTVRIWFREVIEDPDLFESDKSDLIRVDVKLSYSIINYSAKEEVEHRHIVAVDRGIPGFGDNRIVSVAATGSDLKGEEYRNMFRADEKRLRFEKQVRIKPNKGSPNNHFESQTSKLMPRRYGSDVVILTDVLDGARVIIEEQADNLDVEVTFGHRALEQVIKVPAENPNEWRLDAAFLLGQAIYIEWTEKREDESIELEGNQKR